MFRIDGQFIPDPQQGYNTGGLTLASDLHFAENGVPKDLITVMAPPGMVNIDGEPLSGYRVKISRGLLMVAELVTGEQTFRPYQPRTKLKFVDESGRHRSDVVDPSGSGERAPRPQVPGQQGRRRSDLQH